MEKALKRRKLYTVITILGAITAIGSMVGAILFLESAMYYGMLAFAIACAICVYCVVFCSFAAFDAKQAIKVIGLVNEIGSIDVSAISEGMKWRKSATEKIINKYKKHGYL